MVDVEAQQLLETISVRAREREYKPYNQLSKFSKIIIIINNEIYEEGMTGLDICCP